MRIIYCTVGMPASGKSTFLQNSPLKDYVIAPDDLRKLMSTPKISYNSQTDSISVGLNNDINKKVWELLYTMVENRMKEHETIAVDATFLFKSPFSKIKKLCATYGYRLVTLDFVHTGLSFDELMERNNSAKRVANHKNVSRGVLKKFWSRQENLVIPKWWNMIKPSELENSLAWHCINVDKYDNVFVTGDIHSCYTVLSDAFKYNDPLTHPNNLYVFLGDYLDRGTKPAETFKWFFERKDLPNVILLRGNHEYHLENHVIGEKINNKGSRDVTIPALYKDGFTKDDIKKFVRKLQDIYYMEFHGRKYLLTHAGVPTTPEFLKTTDGSPMFTDSEYGLKEVNLLDENVFTKGIGRFSINLEAYNEEYSNDTAYPIQVHGHRNVTQNKAQWGNTINLEQQVEAGGSLATLILRGQSQSLELVKNRDFDYVYATSEDNIDLSKLTDKEVSDIMQRSRDINQKRDKSGLTANNFTPEVFFGDTFNKFSVTARGLFTDGDGRVQLRGFNKFFVLNQRPETELDTILKKTEYPAIVSKKYDGHLVLLGWYDGKPRMFTKSGTTPLAQIDWHNFSKFLHDTSNFEKMMVLLEQNQNKTFLMESLNEDEDSHLFDDHGKVGFRLLEVVNNSYEQENNNFESVFYTFLMDSFLGETDSCYFKSAERHYVSNKNELRQVINNSMTTNYSKPDEEYYADANPSSYEGWVVTFSDGFKFKIKNSYFLALKEFRNKLNIAVEKPEYYFGNKLAWRELMNRSYNYQAQKLLFAFRERVNLDVLPEFLSHVDNMNTLDLPQALNSIGLDRETIAKIISE